MGNKKDLRAQVTECKDLILEGRMLCVDPSSTSLGWAVFNEGGFVDGGAKKYRGAINIRLYKIHADICSLLENHYIDIIIIERLRPVNRPASKDSNGKFYGGGGAYTPVELLWSAGAVLSSSPLPFIEISPNSWKVAAREHDLEKSDANDAKAMGLRVIQLANESK